jgi:hypothetical protein
MVERAKEFGGLVSRAETLAEVGSLSSEYGVGGDRAVDTTQGFNWGVAAGCGGRLDFPR